MRTIGPHSSARFANRRRAVNSRAHVDVRDEEEASLVKAVAEELGRRGGQIVQILRDKHGADLDTPRIVRFFVALLDGVDAATKVVAAHVHEGYQARVIGVTGPDRPPILLPADEDHVSTSDLRALGGAAETRHQVRCGSSWILIVQWLVPVTHVDALHAWLNTIMQPHGGCVVGWEIRITPGDPSEEG